LVTVKCDFLNIFIFFYYILCTYKKSKNIEYKGLTVTVTNRNPFENKGFQGDFRVILTVTPSVTVTGKG
jgi:hypothetical protein